jgi:hypothetical protein
LADTFVSRASFSSENRPASMRGGRARHGDRLLGLVGLVGLGEHEALLLVLLERRVGRQVLLEDGVVDVVEQPLLLEVRQLGDARRQGRVNDVRSGLGYRDRPHR